MKKAKIALALACSLSTMSALEFGTMGSQAFGMAGTGVAIKKSSWGLYYNPALLAADGTFKIGLSGDIRTKSRNFIEIFDRDFNNIHLNDVSELKNLLQDNHLSLKSQIGGATQFNLGFLGALGIGAFANLSAQASAQANTPDFNKPETPHKASINDINLETKFTSFALFEVPVGYAYNFETPIGDLSFGLTLKYMNLSAINGSAKIDANSDFSDSLKGLLKSDLDASVSGFGVDAGMYYEPIDLISFGLVGKNLNTPKFKIGSKEISIDPQARAGMALNVGFWTLGLDADLTANKELDSDFKTQMISLGTSLDFKFVALRAGVATDLQHKDDMIFSLGLGLAFFDLGVQFGKKTSSLNGISIPDYFALQIGTGFSF